MPEVRELGTEHIEPIKSLFAEIFTAEPWNDDWSDPSLLHGYILDLIGNRNSLALGLYEGGELIGLCLGSIMHWCSGIEYYIYEFCVRQTHQGKGLGTLLLQEAERFAKAKGANHIFLQTERGVPAFDFYKKNGFAELDGHVSLVKMF